MRSLPRSILRAKETASKMDASLASSEDIGVLYNGAIVVKIEGRLEGFLH